MKNLIAHIFAAGFWFWAGTAVAYAEPVQACSGIDMFEEMRNADPQSYATVVKDAAAWTNAEAILWRIEKPGIAPSHLFGTVHVSDPRITTLSKAAEAALQSAGTIVVEVADLNDNAVADALGAVPDLVGFADGRSLATLLTPAEFDKVKTIIAKHQIPPELASVFRPWLISMLLAVSDCERNQAAAGAPVLDDKVTKLARAAGKKVIGLETAESQVKALAGIAEDQQLQMLKASLHYAHRLDDSMETILQMYLKRRMSIAIPLQTVLAAKAGVPASAFKDFVDKLIIERNARMRDGSLPELEKGGAFVAVGGLHLPGPEGLVALYRKSGFTVTAVE